MKWEGKKVLVTGAGGFIGSHLVERLVQLGASVTAFIRYNSRGLRGSLEFISGEILSEIKVEMGDLKDPYAIQQVVKKQEIIFHLAALIGIPYSYAHPIEYVQTNILGTSYLLSACLTENIEKFIHTSTSEVYGTARYIPIDEEHPLQGQSPYSASKIAADKLAESFHRSFNLPVAIIRPFNTYGPRQPTRAVIPTIVTQALRSNKVRLGSLTPTRDLNYVEDTVEGFIKIAEVPESVGEVINIGSSKEISVKDLAQKIFDLLRKEPEIIVEAQRIRPELSEVERLVANTEKAKSLLKWSPKISLDNGLKKTIEWIQQNIDFYKEIDSYHI
jgi:NAD dependent epimerase/dehydratase